MYLIVKAQKQIAGAYAIDELFWEDPESRAVNDEKAGFVKTGLFCWIFCGCSPIMEQKGGELLEQLWEQMKMSLQKCERCGLCRTRTQAVWGVGNPRTRVLLVGEAPGKNEDEQGGAFCRAQRPASGQDAGSGRSGSKTEYLYHQYCEMPPARKPGSGAGGGSGLFRLSAGADPDPGAQDYRMPGQDQRYTDHRPRL